jgi:hypothetical protein
VPFNNFFAHGASVLKKARQSENNPRNELGYSKSIPSVSTESQKRWKAVGNLNDSKAYRKQYHAKSKTVKHSLPAPLKF